MATGFSRADFTKGQRVYFGRGRGEQTLGKIVKLNPTKAKVETLESRGNGNGSYVGSTWTVPYSLMRPADADAKPGTPAPPVKREPLTYSPFAHIENLILEAMLACHSGLSPENLTCDGEASMSHIRSTKAQLERQLRGLTIAYGRDVDEAEVYGWLGSKNKYLADRKIKTA